MPCGPVRIPETAFTRGWIMSWRNIETAVSMVVKIGTPAVRSVFGGIVGMLFLVPAVLFLILLLPVFVLAGMPTLPGILVESLFLPISPFPGFIFPFICQGRKMQGEDKCQ